MGNIPDKYNIANSVLDMQKRYMEMDDEETLLSSFNGFMNNIFTKQIQTQIETTSLSSKEVIPSLAELPQNIIAHAINAGITDINAIPARIPVQLSLDEESLMMLYEQSNRDGQTIYTGTIIIDKALTFLFGDFEYHLDYDIKLTRSVLNDGSAVYTAIYDMTTKNPTSPITNPNIQAPVLYNRSSKTNLLINCVLSQLEYDTFNKHYTSNNIIENKSFEFSFENQLASMNISVKKAEDDSIINFTPIIVGEMIPTNVTNYCRYEYIDIFRIRIIFDETCFIPSINDELIVTVQTTQGSKGQFKYNANVTGVLEATDNYDYNNTPYLLIPLDASTGGRDTKSMTELQRLIPIYTRMRNNIATEQDLNDYISTFNNDNTRITFLPKLNNNIKIMFYGYLAMRDTSNRIVPTNTIKLRIKESQFDSVLNPSIPSKKLLILNQSTLIGLKMEDNKWIGEIIPKEISANSEYQYIYMNPFKMVLNYYGPFMSYFLNIVKNNYILSFTYINEKSPLQFIGSVCTVQRINEDDNNHYEISMTIAQNILENYHLFDGEVNDSVRIYAVVYNADGNPHRYFVGTFSEWDEELCSVKVSFKLDTDDIINEDNEIKITNGYQIKTSNPFAGYFPQTSKVKIYITQKFDEQYGLYGLDNIVDQELCNGYTTTNIYTIDSALFFNNYSDICDSVVNVDTTNENDYVYTVTDVPVVSASYIKNAQDGLNTIVSELEKRKTEIEELSITTNNNFTLDLKFYNTYGPSLLYFSNENMTEHIGNVHMSMDIEISLKQAIDDYTKDYVSNYIRDYIESLSNMKTIHIPSIMKDVGTKYENSANYIEFKGVNGLGPEKSHLYYKPKLEYGDVPEILNFDRDENGYPKINIKSF